MLEVGWAGDKRLIAVTRGHGVCGREMHRSGMARGQRTLWHVCPVVQTARGRCGKKYWPSPFNWQGGKKNHRQIARGHRRRVIACRRPPLQQPCGGSRAASLCAEPEQGPGVYELIFYIGVTVTSKVPKMMGPTPPLDPETKAVHRWRRCGSLGSGPFSQLRSGVSGLR